MAHSRKTLMSWTKEELIEHIECLEHNNEVLNKNFEIQYKNCMKIVEDMNIFNKTYKDRNKELDNGNATFGGGGSK